MLYIFVDHKVFYDLAIQWHHQLQPNYQTEIINIINGQMSEHLVIMFGLNHYRGTIPDNYILVQLEQFYSHWIDDSYIKLIQNAKEVWDYSLVNYQKLKSQNPRYKFIPIGYGSVWAHSKLSINPPNNPVNDLVFMGQLNSRRTVIINQLVESGLKVKVLENIWGNERTQELFNAKLIINIHFYPKAILETVRIAYLLSQNLVVLSETSDDRVLDRLHQKWVIFADYDNLVENAIRLIQNPNLISQQRDRLSNYCQHPTVLPTEHFDSKLIMAPNKSSPNQAKFDQLGDLITSSEDIDSVPQKNQDGNLIVKVNLVTNQQLPPISIITITRNRKHMFAMPIRNFNLFKYPAELIEWIIVDDSDQADQNLLDILPDDDRIIYLKISHPTNRKPTNLIQKKIIFRQIENNKSLPLDIGRKRNIGIQYAHAKYIAMMDDDDYYYPLSIYSRMAILLTYPKYQCVGVCDLDVYDIQNHTSARFESPYLSEASMMFTIDFWQARHFPELEHELGEGYGFTYGRRKQTVKMPSCFNLIAITHGQNFTSKRRQIMPNSQNNLLKQLDLESKLFLLEWETQVN